MFTALVLAVMGSSAWLAGCAFRDLKTGSGPETAPLATPATPAPADASTAAPGKKGARIVLPQPTMSRNWKELRLQAARRLVAANPDITYMGKPPDLLRAIPVLTFELNGDGTIRRVEVMRYPSQDRETVNIAIESMRRAAPFGNVSHLPKPWRFNETFLFNNQHKFKPMTLDQL
ncbi:hypothetical protein [Aquabacterium sp.]|uniref:hypothetical protein n=1 Tax=Aquabacterium sp. TaxID=1872578 RepID=UPI003D6D0251